MLDGTADTIRAGYEGKEPACPLLSVPNGMKNLLIHRLGIQSEDNQLNSILIDQKGRIALMASGLGLSNRGGAIAHINVIAGEEEKSVVALLEGGDLQAAKDRIFLLAPPYDPEAVDERGRKPKKPEPNLAYLRARARVYMAQKDYKAALADMEEVVSRQIGNDGGMSLRTKELDDAEKLRDEILEMQGKP
jgi:hypothetical protein